MINNNSISIGLNPLVGQEFFDTLMAYDNFIRDFFFGLYHCIGGKTLSRNNEINRLIKFDTYDYPANILFNHYYDEDQVLMDIDQVMNIVNLKHITVLDPALSPIIKRKFPEIEVQLSVRFWDWGRFPNPIARLPEIQSMGIDVVNVSGKLSYNDFEFINKVHELGMLVKFITDEGCIVGVDCNYSRFQGFNDFMCRPNPFQRRTCSSGCFAVQEKYKWMDIATNDLYKESLQYYPKIDIFKISGRARRLDYITYLLSYWTSDDKTTYINTHHGSIDISNQIGRASCRERV